jgi:hypothetical protein
MTLRFKPPKFCSIAQAALWVARREQPIPDEIFSAAPLLLEPAELKPHGPLRQLLQVLRSGAFPAWASFTLTINDGFEEGWGQEPTTTWGEIPKECWRWQNVDWQNSEISSLDPNSLAVQYSDEPNSEHLRILTRASWSLGPEEPQQRLIIDSVEVNVLELFSLFPPVHNPEQPPPSSEALSAEGDIVQYIPPYVEFMLRASHELGLTPEKRMSKDEIQQWIKDHWPDNLGRLSDLKCKNITTFLRDPDDEAGGHHTPVRKKAKVWPRIRYTNCD